MKKTLLILAFVAAAAGVGYYWYRSRPAPVEKARRELARGRADAAVELLAAALDRRAWEPAAEEAMRVELARAYMARGAYDNAEDQFRRVLEKSPRHFDAHLGLGFIAHARGFEAYAADAFQDAKSADPSDVRAPLALAGLYGTRRAFDQAKREYLEILEREPSHRLARQGLADVLLAEGSFREAVTELEQVAEIFPKEEAVRLALLRAYFLSGQVVRAEQELRARVRAGRVSADARWLLAERLERTGRWEEARDLYGRLFRENPRHFRAGARWAACLARAGRLDECRESLEKLETSLSLETAGSPSFATLYEAWDTFQTRNALREVRLELRLAWARYDLVQGLYSEAEKEFDRALQADERHLETLRARADLHRLREERRERLGWLERAAKIYPRHPELLLDRAEALLALRRVNEALRDVLDARAACPTLARSAAVLSRVFLTQGKTGEARSAAEEALSLDPRNAEAHLTLGSLHALRKEWPRAEASFREAARFDPFSARAHNELGRALNAQKKSAKALSSLRMASTLEPILYRPPEPPKRKAGKRR